MIWKFCCALKLNNCSSPNLRLITLVSSLAICSPFSTKSSLPFFKPARCSRPILTGLPEPSISIENKSFKSLGLKVVKSTPAKLLKPSTLSPVTVAAKDVRKSFKSLSANFCVLTFVNKSATSFSGLSSPYLLTYSGCPSELVACCKAAATKVSPT